MNLILLISRSVLFSLFLLALFEVTVRADSKSDFTINSEPVPLIVATVNGIELTADLLKREMIAYRLMISKQGQTLEIEDEKTIARGLLMKAIDTELIYQQGLKKNLKIDSATIDRELSHIQDQFPDKKLFLAALAAQRLTFDVLKNNIEKTLVKEEFVRMGITPEVTVGNDKVISFYEENRATFTKPETYQVSHIYVSIPAPSEGKAESAKDRVKAQEIIDWVKKEAHKKITQAASALKAGRKFSSVAKEFSEDLETAQKGGDLGFILEEQTLPEIAKAMVKLQPGQNSDVIESSIGFHIVLLTDKKASRAVDLDEVKPEILNHLLKFETEKLLERHTLGR